LRESGLDKNTVVIYTADHGDFACEHDVMEKAPGISSDAITHVPMIWWGPEHFKAGHIANEIVELIDVSNTICDQAGLPLLETSDGKNISHLLHGESGEVHKVGVTEFAWSKSLRKGSYRYIHYPTEMFPDEYPDGFGELYNVEDDPWEMNNLYFDPDYQTTVQELQRDLLNWLVTTTRPTTTNGINSPRNPEPVDNPQRITRFRAVVNKDNKFHTDKLRNIAGGNYL
jgi:choline-sulfatase/uncharacterized sulfatase